MSQKYPGGFITKSPVAPTSSAASGMWTIDQAMQLKKAGTWPPTLPAIGSAFGGGFFAGQIGVSGVATHYLIVGPVSSAQTTLQWKNANTSTTGTDSVIDGPANSTAMNNASHPAAQFCEGRTIGGFSDWYMPARNELEICYYNLKPTTQANSTSYGVNANAVPARASNYTTGTPAQTSATDFQSTGAEDFTDTTYWTSTQNGAGYAWAESFDNGLQPGANSKTDSSLVRAIRRVAV
jgi:hypothetical protein